MTPGIHSVPRCEQWVLPVELEGESFRQGVCGQHWWCLRPTCPLSLWKWSRLRQLVVLQVQPSLDGHEAHASQQDTTTRISYFGWSPRWLVFRPIFWHFSWHMFSSVLTVSLTGTLTYFPTSCLTYNIFWQSMCHLSSCLALLACVLIFNPT